jgi:uracil-DNA glycosylase
LPPPPEPAFAPLAAYRERLRAGGRAVPRFDPLDGGAAARCLILLETPGAGMTADDAVSRDNPGGTARNLRRFCEEAGLARADMLVWNVVPWIVHPPGAANRPVRRAEIAAGLAVLPDLLDLLPALRVVVLSGRPAAAAGGVIADRWPHLPVLTMPHPSPTIVCTSPAVGERIRSTLAQAARMLPPA